MTKNQYTQDKGKGILIVDDEIPNLQLLSELLTREGYQVRPTNSALLAIDSAMSRPPELILLDVKMPEMDGFEVCRYLKQDDRTREVPILFISALQDVSDTVRGFKAGGVDFITKPFQEEEVLARVRTHMNLRNINLNLENIVAERTAELRKSEARYRTIVENSLVGVFTTTNNGQFKFINDAMARLFDFDNPESMIAQGGLDLWTDLRERDHLMTRLHKYGDVTNFETEAITYKDRHIHVIFSVKLAGDNIFGMVMDITERKQVENKIVDYQKRLKALAYEVTIVGEKERRAIATDLHDYVGQSLALARVQIASVRNFISEPDVEDRLDEISNTLFKALEDTQTLMLELGSHSIHESGLSSAVSDWMESEIRNKHQIKTEVIDNISENNRKILAKNVRTILYRNVRELVINVVKHARADSVSVRFEEDDLCIRVIVEDDGIGFDLQAETLLRNKIGGFGLFSIEEFMTDIGGSMRVVSAPAKGCTVILSTPFNDSNSQRRNGS